MEVKLIFLKTCAILLRCILQLKYLINEQRMSKVESLQHLLSLFTTDQIPILTESPVLISTQHLHVSDFYILVSVVVIGIGFCVLGEVRAFTFWLP